MAVADDYIYRVCWSEEDGGYVGTVAELPSLSWLADDLRTALAGIRQAAADVVAEMLEHNEQPPTAAWIEMHDLRR